MIDRRTAKQNLRFISNGTILSVNIFAGKAKPFVEQLQYLFSKSGHKLYKVGGCIRDSLLQRPPHDIDFATDATPEQMLDIAKEYKLNAKLINAEHSTVTFFDLVGNSIEVSTLRGKDIYEDLKCRDITIDTFASVDGKIIFVDTALEDLCTGIIRATGKAEDRFREDPLRIIRSIRLAAELGFTIDSDTLAAMHNMCDKLSTVAVERVKTEIERILCSDHPEYLELLRNLIEGAKLREVDMSQWMRTLTLMSINYLLVRYTENKPLNRWAAFFKSCRYLSDLSIRNMTDFMKQLKFSKDEQKTIADVLTATKYKTDIENKGEMTLYDCKVLVRKIGWNSMSVFYDTEKAHDSALLRFVNGYNSRSSKFSKFVSAYTKLTMVDDPIFDNEIKITGDDLKAIGYKGKEIGAEKDKLIDIVLKNPKDNMNDYLYSMAKIDYDYMKGKKE